MAPPFSGRLMNHQMYLQLFAVFFTFCLLNHDVVIQTAAKYATRLDAPSRFDHLQDLNSHDDDTIVMESNSDDLIQSTDREAISGHQSANPSTNSSLSDGLSPAAQDSLAFDYSPEERQQLAELAAEHGVTLAQVEQAFTDQTLSEMTDVMRDDEIAFDPDFHEVVNEHPAANSTEDDDDASVDSADVVAVKPPTHPKLVTKSMNCHQMIDLDRVGNAIRQMAEYMKQHDHISDQQIAKASVQAGQALTPQQIEDALHGKVKGGTAASNSQQSTASTRRPANGRTKRATVKVQTGRLAAKTKSVADSEDSYWGAHALSTLSADTADVVTALALAATPALAILMGTVTLGLLLVIFCALLIIALVWTLFSRYRYKRDAKRWETSFYASNMGDGVVKDALLGSALRGSGSRYSAIAALANSAGNVNGQFDQQNFHGDAGRGVFVAHNQGNVNVNQGDLGFDDDGDYGGGHNVFNQVPGGFANHPNYNPLHPFPPGPVQHRFHHYVVHPSDEFEFHPQHDGLQDARSYSALAADEIELPTKPQRPKSRLSSATHSTRHRISYPSTQQAHCTNPDRTRCTCNVADVQSLMTIAKMARVAEKACDKIHHCNNLTAMKFIQQGQLRAANAQSALHFKNDPLLERPLQTIENLFRAVPKEHRRTLSRFLQTQLALKRDGPLELGSAVKTMFKAKMGSK